MGGGGAHAEALRRLLEPVRIRALPEAEDRRREEAERQQPEEEPVRKAAGEQPSPAAALALERLDAALEAADAVDAPGEPSLAEDLGGRDPLAEPRRAGLGARVRILPLWLDARHPAIVTQGRALRRLFYARRCDDGAVRRDERKDRRPDDPPQRGRHHDRGADDPHRPPGLPAGLGGRLDQGHAAARLPRHLPRARLRGAGAHLHAADRPGPRRLGDDRRPRLGRRS